MTLLLLIKILLVVMIIASILVIIFVFRFMNLSFREFFESKQKHEKHREEIEKRWCE